MLPDNERHQIPPVARPVQINLQRRRPGAVRAAAALPPRTEKRQDNSADQKRRHAHVGQDADVGVGKFCDRVEDEQQQEREQRADATTMPIRLIQLRNSEGRFSAI